MAGKKIDLRQAHLCPFKKYTVRTYDTYGPNYTPVVIEEHEEFTICIGDDCMLYKYDALHDTEECLMGREPYK